jgi:signal transduction histidine kinase
MSPPIRGILERIEIRAETLRERIKDILLLGELRTLIEKPVSRVAVNLQSIINSAVEELAEKAEEKKITVSVSIPPATVVSNDKQLQILFLNLISNAILYSYDGGKVDISAKQENNSTCVSISDHGIGIRPESLPRIFDEYFRTREAAEFNKLSTGLGLTIVKQISINLNLKIRVSSVEKEGTTFEVIIPAQDTTSAGE